MYEKISNTPIAKFVVINGEEEMDLVYTSIIQALEYAWNYCTTLFQVIGREYTMLYSASECDMENNNMLKIFNIYIDTNNGEKLEIFSTLTNDKIY